MSTPSNFAEFVVQKIETCSGCHEELSEGATAWCNGDAEILCQNCMGRREAMADVSEEVWKVEPDSTIL